MDRLLYRILLGYIPYNPGTPLRIYYPSLQILYESCVLYDEVLGLTEDCLSEEEMEQEMIRQGVWSQADSVELQKLPTQIEELKYQVFLNLYNKAPYKKHLRSFEERYHSLLTRKHIYDYTTKEGVANFAKWQYIISKCTRKGKKRWNWSQGSTHEALNVYYSSFISEEKIREIVRSGTWSSIYSSKKDVFGKPLIKLTYDQHRLLSWSQIYDSAYEQTEYPPKLLIEDDDVFDGWLISNSRKRNNIAPPMKVNPNAHEVFLPAKSKEQAKAISNMNSPRAKEVIKERLERLNKEGELHYSKFKDVQMRKFER